MKNWLNNNTCKALNKNVIFFFIFKLHYSCSSKYCEWLSFWRVSKLVFCRDCRTHVTRTWSELSCMYYTCHTYSELSSLSWLGSSASCLNELVQERYILIYLYIAFTPYAIYMIQYIQHAPSQAHPTRHCSSSHKNISTSTAAAGNLLYIGI